MPAVASSGLSSAPNGLSSAGASAVLMECVSFAAAAARDCCAAADWLDAAPAALGVGNGSDMNATTMLVTPIPKYAVEHT
jgi:hypothetical protein